MTYRLYIREAKTLTWNDQLPNPWSELDLGNDVPAMVYQISDLNKLEDRQALYSQAIKLPKSNRNCLALGFVDSFSVIADEAYSPREVLLTCDDMRMTPEGAFLNINTVSNFIECQIVSGATDLFKSLDTPIDPLADWDAYILSLQELNNSYVGASPVPIDRPDISIKRRWPLIFPYKGASRQALPTEVNFWGLAPCVQFLDFVRFTLRRRGFKFVSDLIGNSEVEKDYITAAAMPKSDIHSTYNGGRWYGRINIPVSSTSGSSVNPAFYGDDALGLSSPVTTTAGKSSMEFTAPNPAEYSVTLKVNNLSAGTDLGGLLQAQIWIEWHDGAFPSGDRNNLRTYLLGDNNVFVPINTLPPAREYIFSSDPIKISPLDKVMCTLYSNQSSAPTVSPLVDFEVKMIEEQEVVSVGQDGYLMRDTGFKSYLEGLQAFVRAYGVMVEVRRYARAEESEMYRMPDVIGEVRMYSFNEIYRRKNAGVYYDWSDKIVIGDNGEQFTFKVGDYAQNNIIEFAENADDDITDSGVFPVNNKALPDNKVLFTIPIESGADINGVASIPILAKSEESVPDNGIRTIWEYEGSKPHLIRINDAAYRSVVIKQGRVSTSRNILTAMHRPASYLINNHYSALAQMLHNAKKISWPFRLDASDIEDFDHFTPVYIEYFGSFFYVAKINNFIAGRLTTCELIRL